MTRINIEINDVLHKKAKLASLMQDTTLQDFINRALEEKVKKDEKLVRRQI